MLNLHIVQAKNGDCFILEFNISNRPSYILIDGGPSKVYAESLSKVLAEIKKKTDKLELIILSHVDDDHIVGLIDLLDFFRRVVFLQTLLLYHFSPACGPVLW